MSPAFSEARPGSRIAGRLRVAGDVVDEVDAGAQGEVEVGGRWILQVHPVSRETLATRQRFRVEAGELPTYQAGLTPRI